MLFIALQRPHFVIICVLRELQGTGRSVRNLWQRLQRLPFHRGLQAPSCAIGRQRHRSALVGTAQLGRR